METRLKGRKMRRIIAIKTMWGLGAAWGFVMALLAPGRDGFGHPAAWFAVGLISFIGAVLATEEGRSIRPTPGQLATYVGGQMEIQSMTPGDTYLHRGEVETIAIEGEGVVEGNILAFTSNLGPWAVLYPPGWSSFGPAHVEGLELIA